MNRLNNPINPRIPPDSLMLRIHQNHLEILIRRILIDPITIQHPQVGSPTSNSLFRGALERALVFELVDALVGGFSVGGTLGHGAFATTAADTHAVDYVALFGFVAEAAGFVGAGGFAGAVDYVQLAELEGVC